MLDELPNARFVAIRERFRDRNAALSRVETRLRKEEFFRRAAILAFRHARDHLF